MGRVRPRPVFPQQAANVVKRARVRTIVQEPKEEQTGPAMTLERVKPGVMLRPNQRICSECEAVIHVEQAYRWRRRIFCGLCAKKGLEKQQARQQRQLARLELVLGDAAAKVGLILVTAPGQQRRELEPALLAIANRARALERRIASAIGEETGGVRGRDRG